MHFFLTASLPEKRAGGGGGGGSRMRIRVRERNKQQEKKIYRELKKMAEFISEQE